jgi:hypothetical protein
MKKKYKYDDDLIFNLDETSLLVKKCPRRRVICEEKTIPVAETSNMVFSCTALFIVDAAGGHFPSQLLLPPRFQHDCLGKYYNEQMVIRFNYILLIFSNSIM